MIRHLTTDADQLRFQAAALEVAIEDSRTLRGMKRTLHNATLHVADMDHHAEALETAAKVLEVLAHGGFCRAVGGESNFAVRAVIHKTPSSASLTDFWGKDPVAAFLNAHAALYPPTPKEGEST
jgi:hypothetical protein